MGNVSTRQAARFLGIFAAKDSPTSAQFLRYAGGAPKWAKIEECLAAIRPVGEGDDLSMISGESMWGRGQSIDSPRDPLLWAISKVPRRGVEMG